VIVTNGHRQYSFSKDDLVAESGTYRLYLCTEVATGRQLLLQVAVSADKNGLLSRAAIALRDLKLAAEEVESTNSGAPLHYERLFPDRVDSFIFHEQGGRRINILAFADIEAVTTMVPLSNTARAQMRIDTMTSAWIMGRLLKLLDFVHHKGMAVRNLKASNLLISPGDHFVVVFDWSSSFQHRQQVPRDERRADITQAASSVFAAIGGDPRTGDYPYGGDDKAYVDLIWRMASRQYDTAEQAHTEFYDLVHALFGRSFHPFTTLPLAARS